MRVLVTGGAGFIGSHLAERLATLGHEVTIYDLKPARDGPFFVYTGSLDNTSLLEQAMTGQDLVCHFAANADVRGGADNPGRDLEQNTLGTQKLLEAMRATGVQRIVFASSSAVYGESDELPTPETCPFPTQTSLYGASKLAAEGLISAYCRTFGMSALIFRFVPVVGERYRHGHLYDFWKKLKADPTQIEVLGDGQQRKSLIYVGDVIDGILAALPCLGHMPKQADAFNVGSEQTIAINDSLSLVCDEMGVHPERTYMGSSWAGDKRYTWLDCTKLRGLGWKPKVSIEDAIRRTVRSFQ